MKLVDGVYEQVLSEDLKKQLTKALEEKQAWIETENFDGASAVTYLASYVEKLTQICLKKLSDKDDDKTVLSEIQLINRLVRQLQQQIPELGQGNCVVQDKPLLTAITNRANRPEPKEWARPETSLSHSFLFTNSRRDPAMNTELYKEILSSDRIDMLVSFIKLSGLQAVYPALYKFTQNGGQLRIITTTYMGATDPKAIDQLSKLPHTEIRISYNVKSTRLHAKSYMFYRANNFSTAYVGSSNLSHAAIADGLEWNMKITQQDLPNIIQKMQASFETYWQSEEFTLYKDEQLPKLQEAIDGERGRKALEPASYTFTISPYPYQQAILDALTTEREVRNSWRNLVVAATGTGKTAISAFDFLRFAQSRKPDDTKLLYVAHRKEILEQAQSCFRGVLQDPNFGVVVAGGDFPREWNHIFMSIQTLQSRKLGKKFEPDYFDMIIADEIHHAPANSYQDLLTYFKPKILLGLTATPERMDGSSVTRYFNNRIAAEIRLPDAIEKRLLAPFHYFGVDDPIDLSHVTWKNGDYDKNALNVLYVTDDYSARKRAEAVLRALDHYTADPRDVRGLGFCISVEHAHYMAKYMNDHGWPSLALDGNTSKEERSSAKNRLESGEVRFIFTVDLFNEGVDIPCVNTELFLRPTNSLTIFLQQLGRGLRLHKDKDCLTVLDFVAQASKNYNYASRYMALTNGSHHRVAEEIKKGFPHAPKGCYIQLEEIAQKRVLENIRSQMRKDEFYRECVAELAEKKGEPPTLREFLIAAQIEAEAFFTGKRNFQRLLAHVELIPDFPFTEAEKVLTGALPRLLSINSPAWLQFLEKAVEKGPWELSDLESQYLRMWQFTVWGKDYGDCGMSSPWEGLTRFLGNPVLKQEIRELLEYLWDKINLVPKNVKLTWPCCLQVHCQYSRDQIFAALGLNKPNSVREGVKYLNGANSNVAVDTDVFLVTLNKSEKEFSDTTLYEDYSVDSHTFHWQSQSTTTPESKTGQRYIHQKENGGVVLLFVREKKQDRYNRTMPFTFLGQATYLHSSGSRPMTILYHLHQPIPAAFLEQTETSGVL